MFSVQPFEVRAVTLSFNGNNRETLVGLVRDKREVPGRDPEFIWRFETPVAVDADTPVVDKNLAALGDLKFRRFLAGSPELLDKAKLVSPRLRLTLDGNNRRQTLLVGDLDPEEKTPCRYASSTTTRSSSPFPDEALEAWRKVRTDMREHRFLRFDAEALTGITIHRKAGVSSFTGSTVRRRRVAWRTAPNGRCPW